MQFLDLTITDDIPDSKTVWNFQEQLTDLDLVEPLFDLFLKELKKLGLIVNEGKIIDGSFVEAPRQRNNRIENKEIKEGKTPESFQNMPHKKSQKVTDTSVHDSQTIDELLDEKDQGEEVNADSAYSGEQKKIIEKKSN